METPGTRTTAHLLINGIVIQKVIPPGMLNASIQRESSVLWLELLFLHYRVNYSTTVLLVLT